MTESELEEFLILRNLDEPLPQETFDAAAEQAIEIARELDDEGTAIRWLKSDVRTQADGTVTGTFCHFRAEGEDAIREHAERAGLPVTRIDRHGKTVANE